MNTRLKPLLFFDGMHLPRMKALFQFLKNWEDRWRVAWMGETTEGWWQGSPGVRLIPVRMGTHVNLNRVKLPCIAVTTREELRMEPVLASLPLYDGLITMGMVTGDLPFKVANWGSFVLPGIQQDNQVVYHSTCTDTLWIAAPSGKPKGNWWGELLGTRLELADFQETVVGRANPVLNAGGREGDVLRSGNVLLQPAKIGVLPPEFIPGRDYILWQPGELNHILTQLSNNQEWRQTLSENGERAYQLWQNRQLNLFMEQLHQTLTTDRLFPAIEWDDENNLWAKITSLWLNEEPKAWKQVKAMVRRQFNKNDGKRYYNLGIIWFRLYITRSKNVRPEVLKRLNRFFQAATERGQHGLVLTIHWAFLYRWGERWSEQKEVLFHYMETKDLQETADESNLLTLPVFWGYHRQLWREEFWSHLAWNWEKTGYPGLAMMSLNLGLMDGESPYLRRQLGAYRLRLGDEEEAAFHLALSCGMGEAEPGVWERWSQLLHQMGQREDANRALRIARMLAEWLRIIKREDEGKDEMDGSSDFNWKCCQTTSADFSGVFEEHF